jgi:predicted secreted protein
MKVRKTVAAAILATLLGVAPAAAADSAEALPIGFSPDGRIFAFEQFGIQDGSGFPYSEIFVIDLETDAWLPDTPIRKRLDDEAADLEDVRALAMEEARTVLDRHGIRRLFQVLAANPPTEVVADRRVVTFDRHYWSRFAEPGPSENRYQLTLSEFSLEPSSGCPLEPDNTFAGFRLEIFQTQSGRSLELHRDENLPASRGCPVSYDIAAVIAPGGLGDMPYLVALIGVYRYGFEGVDRRLIAVPVRLP